MLEPHLEINHSATRLPSPVLITAREMNIAIPINQIVPLANPDNAATLSLLPGERGVTPKNAESLPQCVDDYEITLDELPGLTPEIIDGL